MSGKSRSSKRAAAAGLARTTKGCETMKGKAISHYKVIEKIGHGGYISVPAAPEMGQ